jgi:hypothetical protein
MPFDTVHITREDYNTLYESERTRIKSVRFESLGEALYGIAWLVYERVADSPVPGDANGDDKVDGHDYLVWANHFGDDPAADPPGSPANGDFNDDGVVDGLDYLVWVAYYGIGPNDATTVPEPTSIALAVIGITAATTLAGRRWRSASGRP